MNTVTYVNATPVTFKFASEESSANIPASVPTSAVAANAAPEPDISPKAKTLAQWFGVARVNGASSNPKIAFDDNPDGSLFGKIQKRFDVRMVNAFTENDKKLLGQAYELAHGNEKYEKKLDELSIELGALRIRQQLNGELIRSTEVQRDRNGDGKINSDDHPYQPEPAHYEILGFMKYMAEHRD
ncbi:hypothetical protein FACS1894185_7050 [Betaproteobacteria bacterium]|nr:hypothetical protein FACS1894185_7050 [Betaproteobacteria bacterium]GHU13664.1 hypothetical protein FACS189441_1580 [Betaproteobacteria bacterium]